MQTSRIKFSTCIYNTKAQKEIENQQLVIERFIYAEW